VLGYCAPSYYDCCTQHRSRQNAPHWYNCRQAGFLTHCRSPN
jgi:hypothetical protein